MQFVFDVLLLPFLANKFLILKGPHFQISSRQAKGT